MTPLLQVRNLDVKFRSQGNLLHAVRGIDFTLYEGETLGIVGESGCGKSATAKALMQLNPTHTSLQTGEILYKGKNLLAYSESQMQSVRGKEIGMIFQDPMTSLNPTLKIGKQIVEGYLRHFPDAPFEQARQVAIEILSKVGISHPEERFKAYPHTLSGGMRQRAMIGLSLACEPKILLADEPTTALDVTIQAQILDLLQEIQKETKTSILLITHDMSVVAKMCDRVIVMYAGKIVECAPVEELFSSPKHPYTKRLLEAIPRLNRPKSEPLIPIEGTPPNLSHALKGCAFSARCPDAMKICTRETPQLYTLGNSQSACFLYDQRREGQIPPLPKSQIQAEKTTPPLKKQNTPLVEVANLNKEYTLGKGKFNAVSNLSFAINKGETLGLVGESGCGKSTTGRCLLRMEEPTSGKIVFDGRDLLSFNKKELYDFRRHAQIIFQDPYSSLNPRMSTADIIAEPLRIHNVLKESEITPYLKQLLDLVGLSSSALSRFPHEFSGGQRQRIGIARALALKPNFIVCDEPISALDVSVQAQIINLLKNLQSELGLTYLFIAHDLSVVKYISDRIAVMYMGHIVETAPAEALYANPMHPYTQALLSSIAIADPKLERSRQRIPLYGEISNLSTKGKGCPFASRCPKATAICRETAPEKRERAPGHFVSCHLD